MRILITGASGFIGTNVLDSLKERYEVLNIDITEPRNKAHLPYYKKIDIRDYNSLETAVVSFNPDYILHLAARTDLDGSSIEEYNANTIGVENILKVASFLPDLKKIVITSSQLVSRSGFPMKHIFDYHPVNLYGESKIVTEQLTLQNKPSCDWAIIRPTSIWGPWFGIPYRNFFDAIKKRMYFHIGHVSSTKTYGYIGNSVYQIEQILFNPTLDENNKVFYIGDNPPIFIEEWANEIGNEIGIKIYRMPMWLLKIAAKFGDIFQAITKKRFPMNSYRLGNMSRIATRDLSNTYAIAPNPPYSRHEGVLETIKWLESVDWKKV